MIKPSTILRQEFIDAEVKLINESGLPAFVLIDILERTVAELRQLEVQQYEADKAAWEVAQKEGEQKEK